MTRTLKTTLAAGLLVAPSAHAAQVVGNEALIGDAAPSTYANTIKPNVWNTVTGGIAIKNHGSYAGVIAGGHVNWITNTQSSVISGGSGNTIKTPDDASDGNYNVIAGGHNNLAGDISDVGSGTIPSDERSPHYMTIGGGGMNELYSSYASSISGGAQNVIQPWVNYSVISGGSANSMSYASGYSVISGGTENRIENGAWWGAINGGELNTISGPLPNNTWTGDIQSGNLIAGTLYRATGVAGQTITYNAVVIPVYHGGSGTPDGLFRCLPGAKTYTESTSSIQVKVLSQLHSSEDLRHWGWIGGGLQNHVGATGILGSIGGGEGNGVAGYAGTVPGGAWNHADGDFSFAAGRHAHATHQGSFVWADSVGTDVNSWGANTFTARASGGVQLFTGTSGTVGAKLPAGQGAWVNTSDRNQKDNFSEVDSREILKKVAAMPVTSWTYKGTDVRHIGPVAQDFRDAFNLGVDDKGISTVDADGVALAAIQGLNEVVTEKNQLIEAQGKMIRVLEARLEQIENRLK